jgi:hypothetical protein
MPGRPFPKGVSPNPGGRPKVVGHVRELARKHSEEAVRTLLAVMKSAKSPPAARVAAATAMLDRGYGKPGPSAMQFPLPALASAKDASAAIASIARAVASGGLTSAEANDLARIIEVYVKTIEATEFESRLVAVEQQQARERSDEN